ncbi:hypothetical protein B0H10DRAFT_2389376 [Mycena sp. CBHHK59/15]|nr:hypothetical protein B0H10DRAFT_2389376 [Mycena sp. CBHHK59/15]
MPSYLCEYCSTWLPTRQGLNSHVEQSRICSKQHYERYMATSSESESDGSAADAQKEVEDEDDRWTQEFPAELAAGAVLAECQTQFERLQQKQKQENGAPWAPFETEEEWELARWLMTSGLSQGKTDNFLKLKAVWEGINPSFHNNCSFLQRIDALLEGSQWFCHTFELKGDEIDADGNPKTEIVEMWHRDPLECVRELLGNPSFLGQAYEPRRVFKNSDGTNREYSEMCTADWWWYIQRGPASMAVYITIGNIDKETWRTPSSRATVLLGYIPVCKLETFSAKKCLGVGHQLFHDSGNDGVRMDCADGFVRMMFPILSVYIADYPEQCLVACCKENSCPCCLVLLKARGSTYPPKFVDQNLRPINPFWSDLPHCDIFSCMTPDILHELHNDVFGNHIVSWATSAMAGTGDEIDRCFRAMSPHPSLRHFKKGIALTSQWTGAERKNMEKVFLGVLANATDPAVQRAVRGIIDFIYYAHFEIIATTWAAFHDNKDIFILLEIRKHFDINKLHKIKHYTDSIHSRGTADGVNTENTERLHIDLAKIGYSTTNNKAYTRQMTVWLRRQEAVYKFGMYLQWAVPGYITDIESAEAGKIDDGDDPPEPVPVPQEHEDSDDQGELEEPHGPVASVPTYSVAKKPGFPHLTVASISTDFHAPDFIPHLARFLDTKSIIPRLIPTDNSTFPVYKHLSLTLPRVSKATSHDVQDKIKAVKTNPGQFDTILACVHPQADGMSLTDGLRVAQVRVIFRLPDDFGIYSDPLAYVDWFKPLQSPVANVGMHQVSLSSRSHHQNSSIIPITDIVRSCHLIPIFGHSANPTWTTDNVLDQCKSFYLNPYLRHHNFFVFHYLVDIYTSRKAAEERNRWHKVIHQDIKDLMIIDGSSRDHNSGSVCTQVHSTLVAGALKGY